MTPLLIWHHFRFRQVPANVENVLNFVTWYSCVNNFLINFVNVILTGADWDSWSLQVFAQLTSDSMIVAQLKILAPQLLAAYCSLYIWIIERTVYLIHTKSRPDRDFRNRTGPDQDSRSGWPDRIPDQDINFCWKFCIFFLFFLFLIFEFEQKNHTLEMELITRIS